MSDVNTAAAADEKPRRAKAEYQYINAAGQPVEDIEDATGGIYTALGDNTTHTFQIPGAQAGSVQTMLAVSGWKIEARNAARGVSASRAKDRLEAIKEGDWGVGGEGSRGPRGIDIALLIQVATPHIPAANLQKVTDRINSDPAYRRQLRNHPDIKSDYDAAYEAAHPVTKEVKPLAELFS